MPWLTESSSAHQLRSLMNLFSSRNLDHQVHQTANKTDIMKEFCLKYKQKNFILPREEALEATLDLILVFIFVFVFILVMVGF